MDKFALFWIVFTVIIVVVPCGLLYLHDKKKGKLENHDDVESKD